MSRPRKINKYKYVTKQEASSMNGNTAWFIAHIPGQLRKTCKDEHTAALLVDKKLIDMGKDPVNVLRKQ